jgi:hypothetical protein
LQQINKKNLFAVRINICGFATIEIINCKGTTQKNNYKRGKAILVTGRGGHRVVRRRGPTF